MDRYTSLDDLLHHVWTDVEAAASTSDHPFRTPTFGTVGADGPHLRTVVLRRADPRERMLAFHSDRRSQKVDDLRSNDRIVWHGWDPERSEQLRLSGTATVHTDDAFADAMWKAGAPEELHLYVRPPAPGTPLDAPDDGLRGAVRQDLESLTKDDVAEGRQHFAAIRTVIEEIHWLHLHPEGHYRAQFRWDASSEQFKGSWIVP